MSCAVISSNGLGEFIAGFPCPYDRVIDPGSATSQLMAVSGMPNLGLGQLLAAHPVLYPQFLAPKGLGCCGCNEGLSALTMDGTGLLGTGLFSGGADVSTWGWGEYVVLGLGLYFVGSLISDLSRGVRGVRRTVSRVKSSGKKRKDTAAKRAKLQAKLAEL